MGICLSQETAQLPQKSKLAEIRKSAAPPSPTTLKRGASEVKSVVSVVATPKDVDNLRQTGGYFNVLVFTYSELRAATKNFHPDQILGEGGFGVVYKGVIDENIRPDFVSTQVAVKELNPEGFQGYREWLAEVNYLGQLSHPHLVKLIGYCCEDEHSMLVYEYMACGSLEKHLFRRTCLTMPWSIRMKIALGAAKGLAFLHAAERPIIYCDFKTSNILLDADYNAKLSDFGLAKDGPIRAETHVSTRVVGTYGYAAPEYVKTGHLTTRSDVYGFGVVLLEMLIGRQAVDKSRPSREHNLVEWACSLRIHNKKLLKIVDPRMEGQFSVQTLQRVASLAYQCLNQNPKGRPTMSQVVEILENLPDLLENREDMLLQNGTVTLFEVSKETLESPADGRKHSGKNQGEGQPKVHGRRRAKEANGRSKSEPPLEYVQYSPSQESDVLQSHRISSSDDSGGESPSINKADVHNQ